MSSAGLPTIWDLVAEGAAALPEPFSRAALINWVSARRPDVGVASIATHIQFATENAAHTGHDSFADRVPLLTRVDRGLYRRFRPPSPAWAPISGATTPGVRADRVLLIGSGGATGPAPVPAAGLFASDGFARAREYAVRSGAPWYVLSAKHGLLEPDDVIGPFEVQLGEQSSAYRTAWGEWVVAQLGDRVQLDGSMVEVHGGVDFAQPLRHPLAVRGAGLEIPLPGTWREPGAGLDADLPPEEQGHPDGVDAPVRAVIGKLRELVTRHRPADPGVSDGGGSAHGMGASAS